ncbi:hypothetical protein PMAYCL1PPCAC_33060, partial [Pristionchus mayeri]
MLFLPVFLFLLPLLFSSVDADCLNAKIRLLCGKDRYYGFLDYELWDDNFFFVGGDRKIMTRQSAQTERIINIDDRRKECGYFHTPYMIFTSYCL